MPLPEMPIRVETFRGADVAAVSELARQALGEDVVILRSRVLRTGLARVVEIAAAEGAAIDRFRARLTSAAPVLPQAVGGRGRSGPFTVALVGPTGAGKTTTAVKLALSAAAFGARRVGLLTLDTYRVGALEQVATYAEIATLPLEIVYEPRELMPAMQRLFACDVVLIDTPGRSPAARGDDWRAMLHTLAPDETHFVLPASTSLAAARAAREGARAMGATHLLLTKLDEAPGLAGVAELAMRCDLPARWITDGQEVPADLHVAVPRLMASVTALAGTDEDLEAVA